MPGAPPPQAPTSRVNTRHPSPARKSVRLCSPRKLDRLPVPVHRCPAAEALFWNRGPDILLQRPANCPLIRHRTQAVRNWGRFAAVRSRLPLRYILHSYSWASARKPTGALIVEEAPAAAIHSSILGLISCDFVQLSFL